MKSTNIYTVLQRILVAIIVSMTFFSTKGQDSAFMNRMNEVRAQLSVLAETMVPGLNEVANFSVANTSIQTLLRSLADNHQLNIQIDPTINVPLTNTFSNVFVKDLIYFLCTENQLDVRFTGNILSFIPYRKPIQPVSKVRPKEILIDMDKASNLVTFDLNQDSLSRFTKKLTLISGRNVLVLGEELAGRLVSGYIFRLPMESALEKLCLMNGLNYAKSRDETIFISSHSETQVSPLTRSTGSSRAQPSISNEIIVKDSLVEMDVSNHSIQDIIQQVSSQLKLNYIQFVEITGTTTAKIKGVTYTQLLSLLFQGTPYTYKFNQGVYLIGQRNLEGFRSTEIVKLDFRTIEGIDKEIPPELLKDVEMRVFRELNSIVLSGSKIKIDEIINYLRLIDQPIPNIMIEVIVADAKKGFSIETGLNAILSDSVPATSGQVFPLTDLTLNSTSINNALRNLDSKGVVNLGRVAPNFYLKLKAEERNNNIQIRSTPKLSTMNGNKATLTIGESIYYVEQTQNITGGVNPITTTAQRFNKVEANLQLTISPAVSGNEHITLEISAEFSSFIPPTIENAPPGNATRKFESKIRVRNEEMILLGGLEELTKSDTGSGVPFLARVPVIKWFFSSRVRQSNDNRLIVFIKPTLVY